MTDIPECKICGVKQLRWLDPTWLPKSMTCDNCQKNIVDFAQDDYDEMKRHSRGDWS